MRLICCELREIVGLMSVAVESGLTPQDVKRALVRRGVKPLNHRGFGGCSTYRSKAVQEVFNNVKEPLTNSENGV